MTTRDLVNYILLTGQKGYKDMEDGNRISDKMTLLVKEHIKAEADKMVEERLIEFAEKRGPTFTTEKGQYSDDKLIELCLSDLTALISENYVSKEKHEELLRQRDELREALINVMAIIKDCYPLLFDNEKPAVKQAEAAIKNTETK